MEVLITNRIYLRIFVIYNMIHYNFCSLETCLILHKQVYGSILLNYSVNSIYFSFAQNMHMRKYVCDVTPHR